MGGVGQEKTRTGSEIDWSRIQGRSKTSPSILLWKENYF